jgi:Putative adhesin
MSTFTTPGPVDVAVDVSSGRLQFIATERRDTVVEIKPGGPSEAEARAAAETRAEYADGRLEITAPKARGWGGMVGKGHLVDLVVQLPIGSLVTVRSVHTDISTTGALGDCHFRTVSGAITLDRVGALEVSTASSSVKAAQVAGPADISASMAGIAIRRCDGRLRVRSAVGDVRVEEAGDDVDITTASGAIAIGEAASSVTAKTSNGGISVGRLVRGKARLVTARGGVDFGIADGSAALVDARSTLGVVRNDLALQSGPDEFGQTLEVVARTWYGNVRVQRATTLSAV